MSKIPKTASFEATKSNEKEEFSKLQEFIESEKLSRYNELDSIVNSDDFQKRKAEINAQKYPGSDAHTKEMRFKELTKDKKVKTYYQVRDSKDLADYNSFKDSEKLTRFEELSQFFDSDEFDKFKNSVKQQKADRENEIKQQIAQHKELAKKYNEFYKFKDAKKTADFFAFQDSNELKAYNELEELVNGYNLDEIKQNITQQKQEKERELESLNSRVKELLSEKKATPKGEEFGSEPELNEIKQKLKSKELQKEIKELKFENTEEFQKVKEFEKLKKSGPIKNYFKILNSNEYAEYQKLTGSQEIEEFESLQEFVNSDDFKKQKEEVKNLKFETTDEYKDFQEFTTLKKSADIKQYFKFKDSSQLAIFTEMDGSERIAEFEELKEYVESEEFKKTKEYLLIKDKFKISDEYKDQQEFISLAKDDEIKWYFKIKDSDKFDWIKEWELTFEDDFENAMDSDKWLNGYFWGKTVLNDNYSHAGDNQYYSDGANIEVNNSILKITTRKESVKGKVWHPTLGFIEKDFEYTSGIINTGQSFRQKYGLFQARIRANTQHPVYSAFWLLAEKIVPEIDIFKTHKSPKKLEVNNFSGDAMNPEGINKSSNLVKGPDFTSDFFIYSLEWTSEKLVWKINDSIVHVETQNIPDEPMYLLFSSGIPTGQDPQTLPSTMEIDWVRVYQKREA